MSILSPSQADFPLDSLLYIKFFIFLSPFRMGLTKPGPALGRSLLLSISRTLSNQSGTPPFFTNSFWLASLFALLVGLNLSVLIGALAWFIKITEIAPFESVEVFHKEHVLGPVLFFLLMTFLLLCLIPSAALFMLTIWPFGSPPTRCLLQWKDTQRPMICLERWSEDWCLPLCLNNYEAFFFSVNPHQAHLQHNLLFFNYRLRFNSTPSI